MKTANPKCLIRILLPVFFFALVGLAIHHHHVPPQLISCAICKAKTSGSSALFKPNIESLTELSVPTPLAIHLICYGLVVLLPISPVLSVRFFNFSKRAPPEYFLLAHR